MLKLHCFSLRPIALEIQDIADIRATPAVDALIVVANDHKVAAHLGEQLGDGILCAVGVLIFVHHDVAKTLAICLDDVRILLEQMIRVEQQIVEVHGIGTFEPVLHGLVDHGDALVDGAVMREVIREL